MTDARLVAAIVLAFGASAGAQALFPEQAWPTSFFVADVAGADLDDDGDRDLVAVGGSSSPNSALWLQEGPGWFVAGPPPVVLAGPSRVRFADLNLDGFVDVLAAGAGFSPLGGGVTAVLGDGAGGCLGATMRLVDGGPKDLAVADVNGDGVPDAATANGSIANAALLLGTGTGAFGLPLYLPAGSQPVGVALTDIEGDGDADLAVASGLGSSVQLRRNDGSGGFGAGVVTGAGAPPAALLAAPLDGDALADLVVACSDGTLRVLHADGAGGVLAAVTWPTLAQPVALEAGDMDLDGDLDVLTTHGTSATAGLALLLNDGAGGLSPPSAWGVGNRFGLDVGDVDGDLLPDATAGLASDSFSTFRGDGLGGFLSVPLVPGQSECFSAALVDVDGDRHVDLLVTGPGGSVDWHSGDGATGFGPATTLVIGSSQTASDLAVADATGDGQPDVLTVSSSKSKVSLMAGDGTGGFLPAVLFASGSEPRALLAAQLNGDGVADVVTCNTSGSSVSVLLGGGGTLAPAVHTVVGYHPTAIAAGHFDLDGDIDVVTANEFSADIAVMLGTGTGVLPPGWLLPGDATWVRALAMADLDGDGDDEVLSAFPWSTPTGGRLAVRFSDGVSAFSATSLVDIENAPVELLAADLDVDGALDVAIAHSNPTSYPTSRLSVLRGVGDGTLQPAEHFLHGRKCEALAVADLDEDGLPDLVATSHASSDTAVLRNVSDGTLPWVALGHALAGDFAPKLAGAGALVPGTPGALTLFDAPPLAPGALFFANSSAPAPFKGGTLVPVPPTVTTALVIPPDGRVRITWAAWPPAGSGSTFFFQGAAVDAGAPKGVCLSNAIEAVVP